MVPRRHAYAGACNIAAIHFTGLFRVLAYSRPNAYFPGEKMIMHFMRCKTICLTVVGILLPQFTLAATPDVQAVAETEKSVITDIALHDGGILVGRLANQKSHATANQKVTVRQDTKVVAEVVTDKNGQFIVHDLRGGIYQIESNRGVGNFRAWAPQTAPPTAHQVAFLVENDQVVRGQLSRFVPNSGGHSGFLTWTAIGLGIAGITVGTIALTASP